MFFNHTNGVKMSHSIPIFRYTQQLTMGMVNRGNDLLSRGLMKVAMVPLWYGALEPSFLIGLNLG